MKNKKINDIPIKNKLYNNLKLNNLFTQKDIYSNGQLCNVKLVTIVQQNQQIQILPSQIKQLRYALKKIQKYKIKQKNLDYKIQYQNIYNQIKCLCIFQHPNIIQIYWHFQDQEYIYILMEYGGIKLSNYLKKNKIEEQKIKFIFKQICQALFQCHSKNIMHRDLNLHNIVINSQSSQIKLIDFGLANQFTCGLQLAVGNILYMAPQVYSQQRYNNKADIWSLGIILYQIFHKRNPFFNNNQNFTNQQYAQKRDKLQYIIDQSLISKQPKILIQNFLSLNPQKRPHIQVILKSKWLTNNEDQQQEQNYYDFFENNQQNNENDDNRKTKQAIIKQKMPFNLDDFDQKQQNENELSQLSNESEQTKNQKTKMQKNQIRQSNVSDDFFDQIINKMSLQNQVNQLQNRLKQLISIHTKQIHKKKRLLLQIIQNQQNNLIQVESIFKSQNEV